jgi:hypothetical protein
MCRPAPWLAILPLGLLACVETIDVSHAIGPSQPASEKSSERVGVLCSEDLLAGSVQAAIFKVDFGEPLCAAAVRSAEASFRAAERAKAAPFPGQYARLIGFDLQSSVLTIEHTDAGAIRATCSLSVTLQRYGKDLRRVGARNVHGYASVEHKGEPEALVREAVEAAIQQLADDAQTLLVAGIDGPRQRETAPER